MDQAARMRLARVIGGGDSAEIVALEPLQGGAVRRHWRVDAAVGGRRRRFALRAEGATPLGMGLDLAQEFVLLKLLHNADLAVPAPVRYCGDRAVIGASFHLTEFVAGSADPAALVGSGPHEALAERLGRELGRLHRIRPPQSGLAFFGAPAVDMAAARLADYRARLDAMGESRPVAEWAMRWLARHVPQALPPVLCHGDFRTGNVLVAEGRFAALLDWEFAGWGDPDEDLAWFCSRCWRFGADECEAGGIAPRAALERGYAAEAGRSLDPDRLRYWEAMAALKWLVIALLQRDRFLRQGERSLDLALTGRRAAECEYELLRLTEEHEYHARSS
jgi:aminoglycoside phosphotransferase (APT) family kinase protein